VLVATEKKLQSAASPCCIRLWHPLGCWRGRLQIARPRKESISGVLSPIEEQCGITCAEGYGCEDGRGAQAGCDAVLRRFTEFDGDVHLMVATQVLGRGLDVRTIQWVIIFDMPSSVTSPASQPFQPLSLSVFPVS
jgi:hypothetical protein